MIPIFRIDIWWSGKLSGGDSNRHNTLWSLSLHLLQLAEVQSRVDGVGQYVASSNTHSRSTIDFCLCCWCIELESLFQDRIVVSLRDEFWSLRDRECGNLFLVLSKISK